MNDIHKLSGAYALDALDELERARFEQHLESCPDCRAEVAELRETAALLADESATPAPIALRASVLTGISHTRPEPPRADLGESPVRGARRLLRTPWLVAACLVAVLGVGVGVALAAWQPWAEEPAQVTARDILAAPDAQSVTLSFDDGSSAEVTRSAAHGRAVIVTDDMAAAPDDSVYELWLQVGDEMVPAGLMPPGPDNTVLLEGDAAAASAVGITVEPAGGSPEPTSDPVALFDLTQAT